MYKTVSALGVLIKYLFRFNTNFHQIIELWSICFICRLLSWILSSDGKVRLTTSFLSKWHLFSLLNHLDKSSKCSKSCCFLSYFLAWVDEGPLTSLLVLPVPSIFFNYLDPAFCFVTHITFDKSPKIIIIIIIIITLFILGLKNH